MAVWIYKATTAQGKDFEGKLEAKSKAEAEDQLRRRKLRVTSIKKEAAQIGIKLGTGVTRQDVSRFTRQFSVMTAAGLPLLQCIDILGEGTENPNFRQVLKQISGKIQGGGSLSVAFREHPKIFDNLYCFMVAAGEAGGILDEIFRRLAEYGENAERLRRKIKKAMMYPTIVAIVAVVVVAVLLVFVVPVFAGMYSGNGAQLPAPTQVVINISDFLKKYILLMIIGAIGTVMALKQYHKTEKGALILDGIKMKLPGLGPVEVKGSVARFTRTLGTLLSSGVPILDALEVTANTAGNAVLERAIKNVVRSISGGASISEPLKEANVFPAMVIQMVSVGEKTGGLPDMLTRIADFYDEEVDAAVDGMTSMIEPIIIVFLGVVIGGLLIAMYMPMFGLADTVK
jgi:type IV pilus assembly protein PilC